jgi:hypothetical protein
MKKQRKLRVSQRDREGLKVMREAGKGHACQRQARKQLTLSKRRSSGKAGVLYTHSDPGTPKVGPGWKVQIPKGSPEP